MRKSIITLVLLIIFLIIYFIHVNFFSWFNLAGIKPNIFVIFVLIVGLFSGKSKGIAIGIVSGIFLDFFIGKSIGITAVMLGIVGFFGGYLDQNFSKDSRFTLIIMIIITTMLYEMGYYLLNHFINSFDIEILLLTKIIVIEVVFNCIITIILYPTILKLGYILEKTYKENNILTRYF